MRVWLGIFGFTFLVSGFVACVIRLDDRYCRRHKIGAYARKVSEVEQMQRDAFWSSTFNC